MIAQADETRAAPRGGIVLPQLPAARPRAAPDRTALDDALEAGRSLGFVPRDPQDRLAAGTRRRPGPRRREEQDRLTVAGPRRVTDAFRTLCSRLAMTHWEMLDRLMRSSAQADPAAARARPGLGAATDAGIAAMPTADAPTLVVPRDMVAWVEARVRSARYLDAGDYVRELIRRDQADAGAIQAIEAAVAAAASPAGGADLPAVARRRRGT